MALAFLINRTVSISTRYRRISENISVVFLFIAAIIPDLDIVFYGFIEHHTVTHSITFWAIVYLPLFIRWRMKILPYFVATLSHLVGDVLMGRPTVFYGISSGGYGPFYDYATTHLSSGEFMLARSLLDFSAVILFLGIYKLSLPGSRMLISDRDAFLGLPILGILIISIFIGSSIQGKIFSFGDEGDRPFFISASSILAISHLVVTLAIVKDARIFLRKKESEMIRK